MSDNRGYKEVYYDIYCETCKHKDAKEWEEPCNECIDNFVNLYSHKPINYVEQDGGNKQ